MGYALTPLGLVLSGMLVLIGCGEDSDWTSDETAGCVALCDKAAECEISVPLCRQSCEVVLLRAERLSCRSAFDAVPSCAASATCQELNDSISGGPACASAQTRCVEACGSLCNLDESLFFDEIAHPPLGP